MQAFDFISLFLCNKDTVDDYIEPVPTSYDGRSRAGALDDEDRRRTQRSRSTRFPFDVNPLRVQLIRRRLDRSTFADHAAFREAYFKATPEAVDTSRFVGR